MHEYLTIFLITALTGVGGLAWEAVLPPHPQSVRAVREFAAALHRRGDDQRGVF